jgi:hypothetical protein
MLDGLFRQSDVQANLLVTQSATHKLEHLSRSLVSRDPRGLAARSLPLVGRHGR